MKNYRKKSLECVAVQYDGTNHQIIIEFTNGRAKYSSAIGSSADGSGGLQAYSRLVLETEERGPGGRWIRQDIISEGDFVVTVAGKFYRQSEEVFKYEHE